MLRLFLYVLCLGASRGVRYWKIEKLCIEQPLLSTAWANALDSEAISHEANGVTRYAPYLRMFAADIRKNHEKYVRKKQN